MIRDFARTALSLPLPGLETLRRLPLDLVQRWTEGMGLLASGGSGACAAFQEVANRGQVFLLVLAGGDLVSAPSRLPFPLRELVKRAYSLEPFPALWVIEGLGHDYAYGAWQQGAAPRHLLTGEAARRLPEASLLMLHAGIGLGIAEYLLGGLRRDTPPAELHRVIAEILALCRTNSLEGFLGPALESLGLVTRTFHPELVEAVDQTLRQIAPDAVGFFWHGVGRAIYFLAINFLPCSDWQTFDMARRESPDELARLNAFAGLAWAFVLVNQRQPSVLVDVLLRRHGRELARDGAFANGVASSVIMRFDTTPGAPFIANFCGYQPALEDRQLAEVWDGLVRIPCRQALERFYPVLKAANRLGEVFQYQMLPDLAHRLSAEGAA
jgi:hypothetical protein